MTDYARIYATSNIGVVNVHLEKGWNIIDTSKELQHDGESTRTVYTLGLPLKEHARQLLEIIREYEKYDLKEVLFEQVEGTDDGSGPFWRIDQLKEDYESIVNGEIPLRYEYD